MAGVGDVESGVKGERLSFFRKRNKKLLSVLSRTERIKVFSFFFSKKKCFLLAFATLPANAATLLHYTARLHGVAFFDVAYCLRLDATAYDAHLTARTLGLAEFMVHGRVEGRAAGEVRGTDVAPHSYVEHGRISGESYDLTIAYPGGLATVQAISPPATKYREAVPGGLLPGAIDGMSAIALETIVVTRTSACQGSVEVFDGRQLRRLTTHTAGREMLPHTTRSVFQGMALRCDTVSEMQAGYLKDQPAKAQSRPRFSKAWLAAVTPNGPAVPVRFAFDADFLGDILVDLDSVGVCGGPHG